MIKIFRRTAAVFLLFAVLGIGASAGQAESVYLAKAIASVMGNEPFVVKTAFGELLCRRAADRRFPDTLPAVLCAFGKRASAEPTETDIRAAKAALRQYGFCRDALYVVRFRDVRNTPIAKRPGVRLYDWYFYS